MTKGNENDKESVPPTGSWTCSEIAPWFLTAVDEISPWLAERFDETASIQEQIARIVGQWSSSLFEVEQLVPKSLLEDFKALAASSSESTELERLWGTIVAKAMIAAPRCHALACGLIEQRFTARDATITYLAEAFDSGERDSVVSLIEDVVAELNVHPEAGVSSRERGQFLQALKVWRAKTKIECLWTERLSEFMWLYEPLALVRAFRSKEPERYFETLEKLTLPPAVTYEIYASDVWRDFERIISLLRFAPPVCEVDDTGRSIWNRKISAPLLLQAAFEHSMSLGSPPPRDDDVGYQLDEQIREAWTDLASVLLARSDGRFLGLQWLGYLIFQDHRNDSHTWHPTPVVIDVVVDALAAAGVGLVDVLGVFHSVLSPPPNLEVMRLSGQGKKDDRWQIAGCDAFLAAVLLDQAETEGKADSAAAVLGNLYESLLVRSDQGLYTFLGTKFPTWRHWYPAMLYSGQPGPKENWHRTWMHLAEQRRRAFHRAYDGDYAADDPSFYHACVGLSLIDWLVEEGNRSDAEKCWFSVFEAIFGVAISLNGSRAERWRHALAKLFARLPSIHGNMPRNTVATVVATQLLRLGGDDELFAWCVAMALPNGIDRHELGVALKCQDIDIRDVLNRYADWQERPGCRRPASTLATEARRLASQTVS